MNSAFDEAVPPTLEPAPPSLLLFAEVGISGDDPGGDGADDTGSQSFKEGAGAGHDSWSFLNRGEVDGGVFFPSDEDR